MSSPLSAHPHVQRLIQGERFWVRPESPDSEPSLVRRVRRRLRPVRLHYAQGVHRLLLRWNYHAHRHRPPQVLFVIAAGRCGSNLLVDYLRSIPSFGVTEEILNETSPIGFRVTWRTRSMSLRHIRYSLSIPGEIVVAKLSPYHLSSHGIEYDDLCEQFPTASFLILYRRNLAAQYVSWCRLLLTGQDRARDGDRPFHQRIRIDPEHFEEFCRRTRAEYQQVVENECLRPRSAIVAYEDLARDPQSVFDGEILPLLSVRRTAVATRMRRQGGSDLAEAVANYEEMGPYFESSVARLTLGSEKW